MKTNYNHNNNLPAGTKAKFGKKPINDIKFSPDGTRLAVASGIGILIYDVTTRKELSLLAGHKQDVTSFVFSLDGNLLISTSEDSVIHKWDVATGIHQESLTSRSDVSSVVLSPDGNIFVDIPCGFGSRCGKMCLYDIATGKLQYTLTTDFIEDSLINRLNGYSYGFSEVVFSPDSYRFATCESNNNDFDGDCIISLWEIRTGSRLKILTNVPGGCGSMVFSPDGHTLALDGGFRNDRIELWNVATGTLHNTFTTHYGHVYSLAFSPVGNILASAGREDSTIHLWDVMTGKLLNTFTGFNTLPESFGGHIGEISSMCFSPDGCTLASGCKDGIIMLCDVVHATNKSILEVEETQFDINEINAIVQQIAHEDEQHLIEYEQPIETRKTVEQSKNDFALYDTFNDGYGTKTTDDFYVYEEDSNEIIYQRSYQIQQICEERGIETLCHFTRIENLHSILQNGLLGRSILHERGQQFLWNDADRADRHAEANCLSISFPNYQMFYSIRERMKSEGVNNSQWVVLLLDAKILWKLDCAFCQRNAASNAVRSIPLEGRKKPEALKGMFENFYDIKHQDLQIPLNYPTHPQAEVLVFDQIQMEYINAIHFSDATILEQWRSNYTGAFSNKFFVDRRYFDARSDYEVWRSENFNDDGIPLSYFSAGNDEEPDDFDNDIPF